MLGEAAEGDDEPEEKGDEKKSSVFPNSAKIFEILAIFPKPGAKSSLCRHKNVILCQVQFFFSKAGDLVYKNCVLVFAELEVPAPCGNSCSVERTITSELRENQVHELVKQYHCFIIAK